MSTRGYCGFIAKDRHYTRFQNGDMYLGWTPAWLAEEAAEMVEEDPDVWKKAADRLTNEQTFITGPDCVLLPNTLKKVADSHPDPEYREYLQPDTSKGHSQKHYDIAYHFLPSFIPEGFERERWINESSSFQKLLDMPTFSANHKSLREETALLGAIAVADLDNDQYLVFQKNDQAVWDLVLAADLNNPADLKNAAKELDKLDTTSWEGNSTIVGSARRDLSKPIPSGADLSRPEGFPPLAEVVYFQDYLREKSFKFYKKAYDTYDAYDAPVKGADSSLNSDSILAAKVDTSWDDRMERVSDAVDDKFEELEHKVETQFQLNQRRAASHIRPSLVPLLKSDPVYTKIVMLKRTLMYSNQEIADKVGVTKYKVDRITKGMPPKSRSKLI